jgi:hypothetical protein
MDTHKKLKKPQREREKHRMRENTKKKKRGREGVEGRNSELKRDI